VIFIDHRPEVICGYLLSISSVILLELPAGGLKFCVESSAKRDFWL